MNELRAVRDGFKSIADRDGTDAVMEHVMAIEEALTLIAKRVVGALVSGPLSETITNGLLGRQSLEPLP